jgi:hypothetical protein
MVLAGSLVRNFGSVAGGVILRHIKPELQFPDPVPWSGAWGDAAITLAAALLVIAIQHWVSLHFPAFAASAGSGVAAR